MSRKAEILKGIVKKNPEPARGKSGTDPMDPWNAKSGLAEASEEQLLQRYLKSRGINPDYIPRDTKIAHSKSSAYLSWRNNHKFDESVEILEAVDKEDTITFDIPLLIRMFEFAREDAKDDMALHKVTEKLISIRDKGTLTMADYKFITTLKENAIVEGAFKSMATDQAETKRLNKMSTLQKFRADSGAREKKHDAIQKNSGGMTSAIDRLEKHLNKEESNLDEASLHGNRKVPPEEQKIIRKKTLKMVKHSLAGYLGDTKSEKHHWPKAMEIHADLHKNHGKKHADHAMHASVEAQRIQQVPSWVKEETEQIDEISKDTLNSYKDKSTASLKNAQANRDAAEAGKDTSKGFADLHKKSNEIAKKRVKGLTGYLQRKQGVKPMGENSLDPMAATEAPTGPGEGPTEVQKQMTKSARMIKALYKNKGMKESADGQSGGGFEYDKEKSDKNSNSTGEQKPESRIVVKGGKTMTGEKRDTIEVDPMMQDKPTTPDQFDKPNKK